MRALVAAVAAYAFVLQVLLGGVVATQMAAAGPVGEFVLCQGSGSLPPGGGKAGLPFGHLACAVCSLLSSAPPLPQSSGPAFVRLEPAARDLVASHSFAIEARHYSPQSPRGPPLIA